MEKVKFIHDHRVNEFNLYQGFINHPMLLESASKRRNLYIGMKHRQFYPFAKFADTFFYTDNAHNCLAGFAIMSFGIYFFHDPPNKIQSSTINLPRLNLTKKSIIGGGLDYWRAAENLYRKTFGENVEYVLKPQGFESSADYSFAFGFDMRSKEAFYGYYHNPKGPSGDGWIWE